VNEGGWRVSDSDREAAVEALGEHYATGRLDKLEYDERSARAWSARTNLELIPLFADLPASSVPAVIAPRVPAAPSSRVRAPHEQWRSRRRGRFVPLPLIVVGIVAMVIGLHAPWLLFLGVGALWFSRSRRRARW
jgi:hypothetical protein